MSPRRWPRFSQRWRLSRHSSTKNSSSKGGRAPSRCAARRGLRFSRAAVFWLRLVFRTRRLPAPRKSQSSASLGLLALRDSRLHQFLNQRCRQCLASWKLDSPFRCRISRKLILKLFDHRCRREQAAVLCKRREPHQHFLRLEGRNLVADYLHSFRWHRRPNYRAHLL